MPNNKETRIGSLPPRICISQSTDDEALEKRPEILGDERAPDYWGFRERQRSYRCPRQPPLSASCIGITAKEGNLECKVRRKMHFVSRPVHQTSQNEKKQVLA